MSNAEWCPSGYGYQTRLAIEALERQGHHVAVACNHGLQGVKLDYDGREHYPAASNWGNDAAGPIYRLERSDVMISLCDSWVLRPDKWPDEVRCAAWTPIDHYPVPPKVLAVLRHGKVRPIAMSMFGVEWMQKAKLDPLYVPHAVDTKVFRPQPELRATVRDMLGIPQDAFLAGVVAANKAPPAITRKCFPQVFDAFARVAKRHDDMWLYVHTEARPTGADGIPLDTCALAVGCPDGRVRFPPDDVWRLGVVKTELVANLYSAFDVLLNPSMGEGFGVPIIEAQACGVPVIASNHSAMIELTAAGWLVAGDPWWDPFQESFFFMPHIASIAEALEAAYQSRADQDLRAAAVAFAADYDIEVVAERYWRPAMQELGKPREVGPLPGAPERPKAPPPSRQVRRARERAKA